MSDIKLTDKEEIELRNMKRWAPMRKWFGVKTHTGEFRIYDSKSKAMKFGKANMPAIMLAAQ